VPALCQPRGLVVRVRQEASSVVGEDPVLQQVCLFLQT
jgi:hypothetical protein